MIEYFTVLFRLIYSNTLLDSLSIYTYIQISVKL